MFSRFKNKGLSRVDVDELESALDTGATLLDVREKGEFRSGHVPGARLVPLSQVPGRVQEFEGKGPVYVICASGGRSARATALLRSAGVDARNVSGGTSAWSRSGKRLERGA